MILRVPKVLVLMFTSGKILPHTTLIKKSCKRRSPPDYESSWRVWTEPVEAARKRSLWLKRLRCGKDHGRQEQKNTNLLATFINELTAWVYMVWVKLQSLASSGWIHHDPFSKCMKVRRDQHNCAVWKLFPLQQGFNEVTFLIPHQDDFLSSQWWCEGSNRKSWMYDRRQAPDLPMACQREDNGFVTCPCSVVYPSFVNRK